jgi:glucokinase
VKYFIAVDVGATKIHGGILDENLKIIHEKTIASRESLLGLADKGLQRTKNIIVELMSLAAKSNINISSACVGFPEYVSNDGQIISKDTIDWQSQPRSELLELTGLNWVVESDVRCAAMGELHLIENKSKTNFLYVLVSSGISHTMIINGRAWTGANGRAIGFGVTQIEHGGQFKSLESVASGLGIAREYERLSGVSVRGAIEVFQQFNSDSTSRIVIKQAAEILSRGLINLVEVLDPSKIIIGGGLWLGSQNYRELVGDLLPRTIKDIISMASLSNSGLIGAGVMAQNSLKIE